MCKEVDELLRSCNIVFHKGVELLARMMSSLSREEDISAKTLAELRSGVRELLSIANRCTGTITVLLEQWDFDDAPTARRAVVSKKLGTAIHYLVRFLSNFIEFAPIILRSANPDHPNAVELGRLIEKRAAQLREYVLDLQALDRSRQVLRNGHLREAALQHAADPPIELFFKFARAHRAGVWPFLQAICMERVINRELLARAEQMAEVLSHFEQLSPQFDAALTDVESVLEIFTKLLDPLDRLIEQRKAELFPKLRKLVEGSTLTPTLSLICELDEYSRRTTSLTQCLAGRLEASEEVGALLSARAYFAELRATLSLDLRIVPSSAALCAILTGLLKQVSEALEQTRAEISKVERACLPEQDSEGFLRWLALLSHDPMRLQFSLDLILPKDSALEEIAQLRKGGELEYALQRTAAFLFTTTKYEERLGALREQLRRARRGSVLPSVLIVGGGPAGMVRALVSALHGCKVRILELRPKPQEGPTEGRPNVLVLGKEENGRDVALLKFLGIYAWLEEHGRLGTFGGDELLVLGAKPLNWPTVRINDLEEACRAVIRDLLGDEVFEYQCTLAGVAVPQDGDLPCLVSRRIKDHRAVIQSVEQLCPPLEIVHVPEGGTDLDPINLTDTPLRGCTPEPARLVLLADGAHSFGCRLLGIRRLPVSRTTRISVSSFVHEGTPTAFTKKLGHTLSGIRRGIDITSKTKAKGGDTLAALQGTLLFRVPHQDYLIRGLNDDDIKKLAPFEERIRALESEIERTRARSGDTRQLSRQLVEVKAQLEDYLKDVAIEARSPFDALEVFSTRGFSVIDLNYKKTTFVDVTMRRAERPGVWLGDVGVLIGGDALQEVDPASGAGAATALQSACPLALMLRSLREVGLCRPEDMTLQLLVGCYFAEKGIAAGFHLRHYYQPGTAVLQRIVDSSVYFTPDDGLFLRRCLKLAQDHKEHHDGSLLTLEEIARLEPLLRSLEILFYAVEVDYRPVIESINEQLKLLIKVSLRVASVA